MSGGSGGGSGSGNGSGGGGDEVAQELAEVKVAIEELKTHMAGGPVAFTP